MGHRGPRGDGTIDEHEPGLWRWRRSTMVEGKRVRVVEYFTSRDDAEWAQRAARPLSAGDAITFGEYAGRWLAAKRAPMVRAGRESHFDYTDRNLRLYLIPEFKNDRLTMIKPTDCDRLWVDMLARGLSRKTVTGARSVMRQVLKEAERNDLLHRNVAALSELPALHRGDKSESRSTKAAARSLTRPEARRLLGWLSAEQAEGSIWALPSLVALFTGARRGEIAGIRWCDIDRQNCEVSLVEQLVRIRGSKPVRWERRVLKTAAADRTMTLPLPLIELLLSTRPKDAFAADPVFDINPDSWTNWWDKKCRPIVGLKKGKTIHGLRHTHASFLIAAGVSEDDVAKQLGHSTVLTTRGVYVHPTKTSSHVSAEFVKYLNQT